MYLSARLYNTTLPPCAFTLIKVGKRVPSPHLPWSPSSLRTRLAQTADPIRSPAVPEDRLHIRLGQRLHSPMLQAGSTLPGIPRSVLRGRSPSGLHQGPLPQPIPSSDAEGWRVVDTALQETGSYTQNIGNQRRSVLCPSLVVLCSPGACKFWFTHYLALHQHPDDSNRDNFLVLGNRQWHLGDDKVDQNLRPKPTSPSSTTAAIEPERENLPPLNLVDNLDQIVWRKSVYVDPHDERQKIDEVIDVFIRLARLHPTQ